MLKLIDKALDFIFPPVCGFCEKFTENYICNECMNILKNKMNNKSYKYVGKSFDEHYWLFKYEDEIRDMILKYKFNEKSYLYRSFSELILDNKDAVNYLKKADYIVSVPIHKSRLKERGYNQCELIAKRVSEKLNIKYIPQLLYKSKNTVPQSTLNRIGRMENIKGVFSIKQNTNLCGKNITLFDDIYTTGSTVEECAKQLKMLGCNNICVFTFAKN